MAVPAYFFAPLTDAEARTQTLVPYSTYGFAVPVYDSTLSSGQIQLFSDTTGYLSTVPVANNRVMGAYPDQAGGFYSMGLLGSFYHINAEGAIVSFNVLPSSGEAYANAVSMLGNGYGLS